MSTKYVSKMHHGRTEMTTWPKTKSRSAMSSNERREQNCVDYAKYLNQIWYTAQASDYQHEGTCQFD